ncbi:MAG: hypothetical protein WD512_13575 [Candidatus Paceibacterota bacterium]
MTKEDKVINDAIKVIKGLLKIAEVAMPNSNYQSDRRIIAANKFMEKYQ